MGKGGCLHSKLTLGCAKGFWAYGYHTTSPLPVPFISNCVGKYLSAGTDFAATLHINNT